MQQAINTKFVALFATLAMAFAFAFTAFAYEDLGIEVTVGSVKTEVKVLYSEVVTSGEATTTETVTKNYTYETTNLDDVYAMLADDLDITESEVRDAVVSETTGNASDDDEMEDGDDDDDGEEMDDNNDDSKDRSEFCKRTTEKAAGFGVAKKCVNEEGYQVNDKLANKVNRFADYGKSTDKAVLQGQLRELLLVLIQLLQQQMALQNTEV
ncbi:hypothetical protein KC887_03945 [Candidatus Kaiserbacteria bacterium]|nr:hypothetical protein [Candidatus Kaiserbacteria bacterium]